jgi:hypothetical protein
MNRSGIIPTMHKKSWKDHLLSSGVPLEYSVIRIFEELQGEGGYEDKTKIGRHTEMNWLTEESEFRELLAKAQVRHAFCAFCNR